MNLESLTKNESRGGVFTEIFKLEHDGQVSCLIIDRNETRGNHYHEHKIETFVVLYGSAVIRVRDRDTNNVMTVHVGGSKPMAVTIYPNNTHSITANEDGAVVAIWCNEQFDKDNPDTIGEEV